MPNTAGHSSEAGLLLRPSSRRRPNPCGRRLNAHATYPSLILFRRVGTAAQVIADQLRLSGIGTGAVIAMQAGTVRSRLAGDAGA